MPDWRNIKLCLFLNKHLVVNILNFIIVNHRLCFEHLFFLEVSGVVLVIGIHYKITT